MKKIIIIAPHFPPSNLASVHRSRLFAQHLPEYGWKPIILTVHEKYYEEQPDINLEKLLPKDLRIEKVKAFPVTRPRLIGDLGIRSFFQLYRKAKSLIKNEKIDFVYIPIPSFYTALLGRWLHSSTGIPYGIDYIDPWVHDFPGSNKFFSRHWLSTRVANFFEPIAVRKASLITGVSEGYYRNVLIRNPFLKNTVIFGAMPYGGEMQDHAIVNSLGVEPYLLKKKEHKFQLVYAGAMLPKAYQPLEKIFESIVLNAAVFAETEIHFIGTGKKPDDPNGYNIKPLAQKYGLWEKVIFEYPRRIPYLDVIAHLNVADAVFILGSTEPHYTPSKIYQAVLSGKPILAVLHKNSTAVNVIHETGAGLVLDFDGINELAKIKNDFTSKFMAFRKFAESFKPNSVDLDFFEDYSAKAVTRKLALFLNKIVF